MKEYEEKEVIDLIRKELPDSTRTEYSDDDLLNIVDMIWDYYEINGLLDVDAGIDEEEDIDIVSELIDYAKRMLKKDKACQVRPEHLENIIRAELAYEDILDGNI